MFVVAVELGGVTRVHAVDVGERARTVNQG